jgi:hypothetical protein
MKPTVKFVQVNTCLKHSKFRRCFITIVTAGFTYKLNMLWFRALQIQGSSIYWEKITHETNTTIFWKNFEDKKWPAGSLQVGMMKTTHTGGTDAEIENKFWGCSSAVWLLVCNIFVQCSIHRHTSHSQLLPLLFTFVLEYHIRRVRRDYNWIGHIIWYL